MPDMTYAAYLRSIAIMDRAYYHPTCVTIIVLHPAGLSNNGVHRSAITRKDHVRGAKTWALASAIYWKARAAYPGSSVR